MSKFVEKPTAVALMVKLPGLAAILGVSNRTLRRMVLGGEIPPHCYTKRGDMGHYFFHAAAIEYRGEHGEWPPSKQAMARFARQKLMAENEQLRARVRGLEEDQSAA